MMRWGWFRVFVVMMRRGTHPTNLRAPLRLNKLANINLNVG